MSNFLPLGDKTNWEFLESFFFVCIQLILLNKWKKSPNFQNHIIEKKRKEPIINYEHFTYKQCKLSKDQNLNIIFVHWKYMVVMHWNLEFMWFEYYATQLCLKITFWLWYVGGIILSKDQLELVPTFFWNMIFLYFVGVLHTNWKEVMCWLVVGCKGK